MQDRTVEGQGQEGEGEGEGGGYEEKEREGGVEQGSRRIGYRCESHMSGVLADDYTLYNSHTL